LKSEDYQRPQLRGLIYAAGGERQREVLQLTERKGRTASAEHKGGRRGETERKRGFLP